jgi:tellurite resistance protein TerC
MPSGLFPFAQYWRLYLAFTGVVTAVLLTVDLTLHPKASVFSYREAVAWTGAWIALALAFSCAVYLFASHDGVPGWLRAGAATRASGRT